MAKKNIYLAFFLSFLLSCISEKSIVSGDISQYESNQGYKNLYVVDTIQLSIPVVKFFTKDGYCFVMSKKYFDSFNGSEKDLFENKNAFLVGDLPLGLPESFYKNSGKEIDCPTKIVLTKKRNIQEVCYEISPDYFILLLVNGDYFNSAFIGIDGASPIKDKMKKNHYYKVLIPVCISSSDEL